MRVQTTTIESGWEVAERTATAAGEADWIPARVPGHVHLDLMRAGVIGDPFWRMQERGCRWVDETDWTYRTTFAVDADRLASCGSGGRHFLHFHGLDTLARVFLNGTPVGAAENFFVPHRFDVTEVLREGPNELRVEFDSALRVGRERAAAYLGEGTSARGAQSYFNFAPRAFVRKPQYMFGWDWGPELVSCGIWQPVELVTVPVAEIEDWRLDYEFLDEQTVDLTVRVRVRKYDDTPLLVGASLFAPGDTTPLEFLSGGPGVYEVPLAIHDLPAARWNPHNHPGARGGRKRFLLNLRLAARPEHGDTPDWFLVRGESVGFRTVELVREPDPDGAGEGFLLRVNGVDTFIKGANWIPDDSFPARIDERRLRERLTQARDAGFNLLRVWGGGLYETETFYDLCDELGLMVWQDFPFACSSYPDDEEWFVEQVRAEAIAAVRRIRNHPCLALWCGGNENVELFQDRWAGKTQATEFFGDRIIHETLPAVLAAEDPGTPYWPNSPYGGDKATSEDFGDSHYWNVWHSKLPGSNGDWTNYRFSRSRFSSEFGFAAPAGPAAWAQALAPEDRGVRSAASRWHDKTRKGYETYLNFIAMHFPAPRSFDDLVYYGQMNQAEALRFGVEHWRRMKGRCWGTLFWQLNDCWPTHSWSVIDSAGAPKAAYHAARRFYAPLLLSLTGDGDEDAAGGGAAVPGRIRAYLVNDTPADVRGRLLLRVLTFDGEEVTRHEQPASVAANALPAGPAAALDLPGFVRDSGTDVFVHATFGEDNENGADAPPFAENFLLLAEPKDLRLPDPGLSWSVDADGETGRGGAAAARVTVRAERFAAFVWLSVEGGEARLPVFSDNGFHLAPGQSRTITVSNLPAGRDAADLLHTRLRVRHL